MVEIKKTPDGIEIPPPGPDDMLIPLDSIEPNPWQARKTVNPEELAKLAESIAASGLLQTPMGRRLESGTVQLAFGHRRVKAIRMLAKRGLWKWGAPVILKDLTDQEMAILTLEENAKREDISFLEQLQAYKRVIDDGLLTITALAHKVGLERSTVSNNLRLLNLPEAALERLGSQKMSAHAARELLTFCAPDHSHKASIMGVIESIEDPGRDAPDWKVQSVRREIRRRVVVHEKNSWRPLTKDVAYGMPRPAFDTDAFALEFPTDVHTFPAPRGELGERWTCNVAEWRRWQVAAQAKGVEPVDEPLVDVPDSISKQGTVSNEQNTSFSPLYYQHLSDELDSEEENTDQLNFGLEKDLQRALRANIQQLESGLEIVDGGVEKSIEAGRIDITAEDSQGCLVVIELKTGMADLRSVGQVLSYMSSVSEDPSRRVRGILVANDFDGRVIMAARKVPDLSLVAYSFQFSFSECK